MDLLFPLLAFTALGGYLWWNRSALHVAAAHRAFRRGDEPGTLAAFLKAEAAGRLSVDATVTLAYLLLKAGRTDEAGDLLDRALAVGRRGRVLTVAQRRQVTTYRTLVLWKVGRLEEAVLVLEGLLSEGYRTATLYGNLGFFLVEVGNLPRAEAVCLEAVEWDPAGKVMLDNLAAVHLAQGEATKAVEVYHKLLPLDPKFPEAWYGAGRAALATGDVAEARRCWEKALTLPFHALSTVERPTVEQALADLLHSSP